MNKVILMGRLTRNPEIRYSQNDTSMAVARFTLAVDRRFRKDSENSADFISCVAFGKTAEFFERYAVQGTKMVVEGRIQTGSYTKQDGSKVYTTDVVVENAEFAESRGTASGQPSNGQPQAFQPQRPAQQSYSQPASQPQAPLMREAADEGFMQIPDELTDEGLPFI
ncbi:MAG: single-stranded DNA-binding protein [Parasporobacterium sp.]|nr:single-stranded DNA-binding protein [Parasporobacterium sp.]